MKEKVMKGMKMNKALLPLLLCCFIFPASGKDAGWQWYNEKINPKEKENKPVPAAPRQEPDIMQKLAALKTATKRALYEAILYHGVDNFVKLLDSAGRAFHHERQKSHAGASRTGL